jgi:(p)ppGpp synthase/HD superfamily hydrolase
MIFRAIEFAAAAHRGQYRKGTRLPYILHPMNAARLLIDANCEEHVVTAALLHDVLEDTSATAEELVSIFGPRVCELVVAVTEPDKVTSWEDRKNHTLAILRESDAEVLLVALADKLDNIRSIREDMALHGESTWKRFRRGRDHQRWYYESLCEIFLQRVREEPGKALVESLVDEVRAVFDGSTNGHRR